MSNDFEKMGFTGAASAASTTPNTDGYIVTRNALPYHVCPETPAEWAALQAAIAANQVVVEPFVPPPAPSDAQLLAAFKRLVLDALRKSDNTALRIQDAIIKGATNPSSPDVVAWAAYRVTLRELLLSPVSTSLPVQPAYPAGT